MSLTGFFAASFDESEDLEVSRKYLAVDDEEAVRLAPKEDGAKAWVVEAAAAIKMAVVESFIVCFQMTIAVCDKNKIYD